MVQLSKNAFETFIIDTTGTKPAPLLEEMVQLIMSVYGFIDQIWSEEELKDFYMTPRDQARSHMEEVNRAKKKTERAAQRKRSQLEDITGSTTKRIRSEIRAPSQADTAMEEDSLEDMKEEHEEGEFA